MYQVEVFVKEKYSKQECLLVLRGPGGQRLMTEVHVLMYVKQYSTYTAQKSSKESLMCQELQCAGLV